MSKMREKIAKELFHEGLEEHYTIKQIDNIIDQILTLIREEIKPELEAIGELTSSKRVPYFEYRKISERIQAILRALEAE